MRCILCLFMIALLSVAITGCSTSRGKDEIPFTVIETGYAASDYPRPRGMVIRSQSEWEAVWEQLHRYTLPQPALPKVDFSQYTLVAVFAGEKQSGGNTIQVKRVIQTERALTIHVSAITPEPDQMTIAQIIYPYQIVKIPRTDLPVHFGF